MKVATVFLFFIAAVALAGCATTTGERRGSGALLGAGTGAAIGSLSGNAGKVALIGAGGGYLYDQDEKWQGQLCYDQNRTRQDQHYYDGNRTQQDQYYTGRPTGRAPCGRSARPPGGRGEGKEPFDGDLKSSGSNKGRGATI